LWATKKITEHLNDNYQYEIDTSIYDEENYLYERYPECYLGSAGRAATLGRTKKDDFTLIMPNFDTRIYLNIPEFEVSKEGEWKDTIINYNKITEDIDSYSKNQYRAYGYGPVALLESSNKMDTTGKRVLIIKDSFFHVVVPFLCLGVEELTAVDVRHFDGSLKTYIDKFQPDVVILGYYPDQISTEETIRADYNSHDSAWDFR